MKILLVIHRYPPFYLAGSETYTYLLARELVKKSHEVFVFTRIENPFEKSYHIEETIEEGVHIIRVNRPITEYRLQQKYLDHQIDLIFMKILKQVRPDIVHIGHLSHLSTNLVQIAKKLSYPIIFTLHDFWLLCLRGQLITRELELCNGPTVEGCMKCFNFYFSSDDEAKNEINKLHHQMKTVMRLIDHYIAPSQFLRNIFVNFGIPTEKITYLDYGFNIDMFKGFKRNNSTTLRFGFTGRIIPTKGIHLLLKAFDSLNYENIELHIYGELTTSGKYLKEEYKRNQKIFFHGEYTYHELPQILANIDVLVVPSLWYENSPLVIHEAFLAKIPVITSNIGGMAELVQHEVNGLLFEVGNIDDLKKQMERLITEPTLLKRLQLKKTHVDSISHHTIEIINLYEKLIQKI